MELTLGPVLFHWQPDAWRDFYFRIADEAPIDTVSLGEVVCSKRTPFIAAHLPQVVERLKASGKNVLLSTLALATSERERRMTAELVDATDAVIELNDVSGLARLAGRSHAVGPFVNVYNEATAAFFARRGASRICLPPELPAASISAIAAALPEITIEVFAFGRIPLAISARCYHARLHDRSKDNCQFVCGLDPDGLAVDTLDAEHFLAINGVQTLSHACVNLLGDLPLLTDIGVSACRLSPQSCDMVALSRRFRDVADGRMDAGEAASGLPAIVPDAPFANGFLHGLPGAEWLSSSRSAPGG